MESAFVPVDFEVPLGLDTQHFRLEPLGPQHNDRDHEAWMSSIDHISSSPGFDGSPWPTPMTVEENLGDLLGHARDFEERCGFTYSVLDGADVIGCVYIYPSPTESHDAEVRSWVRGSRSEIEEELRTAVSGWLEKVWPFSSPSYPPRG